MYLLPRMNVILDYSWSCQSSCEEHGLSKHYKTLVHGRIRTTNTARTPEYKSNVITTRPQLAWYEMELNVHAIYIHTIYKETWKGACIYRINNVSVVFYFNLITYEYEYC